MARCYIRNGVWGWSEQEQEAALKAADVFDAEQLYRDEIAPTHAKKPSHIRPEWLEQRAVLLKPTRRRGGETIYVASLLVFGVNEADLIAALAAAEARQATVIALDSGLTIPPGAGMAGSQQALEDWQRGRKHAQTKPGRQAGNRAAAERRRRETMRKLTVARPLWGLPTAEISSEEIARRSELSVKTLYSELGRRGAAQKRKRRKQ